MTLKSQAICLCALVLLSSSVDAQDMQVSDFVTPNEGWRLTPSAKIPSGPIDGVSVYVSPSTFYSYYKGKAGDNTLDVSWISSFDVKGTRVDTNIGEIISMTFRPDQDALIVSQKIDGKHRISMFRIKDTRQLDANENYYTPQRHPTKPFQGAQLTVDRKGCLYAATERGVQIFDPIGRLAGILAPPTEVGGTIGRIAFTGKNLDELTVVFGDQTYTRTMKSQGLAPFEKK